MIKRTLQELCLNITDGKHGDCENEENSGYYFISCKDIFDGQINYKNARQITKADFEETHKRTMLEVDDILLTNSGTIGRMAFVTDREATTKTTFQKSVAIIKPDKQKVLPRYLYYQLQNCVPQFINSSNGSAQKNLLLSTMRTFQIEIEENREKQEKIANTLSAYDDLIENNQKQIKLLEEAARRLYKEWFVDLHFPGYENTKIVDGVPEGWIKEKIGKIIKKVHRTKQIVASEYKDEGSIPIVDQSRAFVAGYTNDLEARVDFGIPIIVFGDHTRIVKLIQFPFAKGADGTQLIISDCLEMPQRLLYCSIMNIDLSNYHYARHFKYLKEEKIMIPTVKVANEFENNVTGIFSKIQNCRDEIIRCQKTRDLLLPKLMSGEVEV